jgi:hypothetical protein
MARFTYNDIVRISKTSSPSQRCGERAWVVAVIEDRDRFPLAQFHPGVVYTVEFENGDAADIHEDDLEYA